MKISHIKRRAVLLLLLSMALSACGEKAENNTAGTDLRNNNSVNTEITQDNETIIEETELTDGIPDTDMNGLEFNILNYDGTRYWWSLKTIAPEELNSVALNDAMYNRNTALEERFNCKICENLVALPEDNLKRDVVAGLTDYQMAMINDQSINGCLTADVLYMWNDMKGCELTNPWWNANANMVFQIAGQQYAAVGDFNLSMYSKSYMIYFNKDLYGKLNPVDELYQLVRDGKWTYDIFMKLSEQYLLDLDGNGVFDNNDQYGVAGYTKVLYQALLTGADVHYVEMNEENNPYFDIPTNERSIDIMQKISEAFGSTKTYFRTADSKEYMAMFSGGQLTFLYDTMWDTETYRAYDIGLGMLPAPKWDEAQENYRSITVGGVVSALPKTLKDSDIEYVGMLLEAMGFASRRDTLPVYKEAVLKGKYARDSESVDMIDIIFDSQVYDLGVTIWDIRGTYMTNMFENNKTDAVSITQKFKKPTDSQIMNTINKVLDGSN